MKLRCIKKLITKSFIYCILIIQCQSAYSLETNLILQSKLKITDLDKNYFQFCSSQHFVDLLKIEAELCFDLEIEYSEEDRVLFVANPRLQTERLKNHYEILIKKISIDFGFDSTVFSNSFFQIPKKPIKTQFQIGLLSESGHSEVQIPQGLNELKLRLNLDINLKTLDEEPQLYGAFHTVKEIKDDKSVKIIFENREGRRKSNHCALKNQKLYCWGLSNKLRDLIGSDEYMNFFELDKAKDKIVRLNNSSHQICIFYNSNSSLQSIKKCLPNDESYKILTKKLFHTIDQSKTKPKVMLGDNQDPIQFISITSGMFFHTYCAVFTKSRIKCWGHNTHGTVAVSAGELSFLTLEEVKKKPYVYLDKNGTFEIISIKSARDSFCALFNNGRVKCWGSNEYGQIGQGPDVLKIGDRPGEIESLNFLDLGTNKIVELYTPGNGKTARYFCARYANFEIICWGNNYSEVHGRGYPSTSLLNEEKNPSILAASPIDFGNNNLIGSKLYLELSNACLLFQSGKVKCWGSKRHYSQHNIETQQEYLSSTEVFLDLGTEKVKKIITNDDAWYAIQENNVIRSWGKRKLQENEEDTRRMSPIYPNTSPIPLANKEVLDITLRFNFACILFIDGKAKCWDRPDNYVSNITELKELPFGTHKISKIYAFSDKLNCALFENGKIKCWGNNRNGILGQNIDTGQLTDFKELENLDFINLHTTLKVIDLHLIEKNSLCAEFEDFSLKCWGANSSLLTGNDIFRFTIGNQKNDMENLNFITFE